MENHMQYVQNIYTVEYLSLSGSSDYVRSGHKHLIAVNNYT
jgi:hypothetical protein